MSRAMAVTVLYRLAGEPEVTGETAFTDVNEEAYYYRALLWASQNEIAKGITETKFAPNGSVTREQAVTFLYRYVVNYLSQEPASGSDLSVFRDADEISTYAKEAMAWAAAEGLLEGYGDGTVGPMNPVTRAQMAKFLTVLSQAF